MAGLKKGAALLLAVSPERLELRWLTPGSSHYRQVTTGKLDQALLPAIAKLQRTRPGQTIELIGLLNNLTSFAGSRIILSHLNSWAWLRQIPVVSLTDQQFRSLTWPELSKFQRRPIRFLQPLYRTGPEIGRARQQPGFTWQT